MLSKLIQVTSEHLMTVAVSLFIVISFGFVTPFMFQKSLFGLVLGGFFILLFAFIFLKDDAKEASKKVAFVLLKLSFVLMAMSLVNHGVLSLAKNFPLERLGKVFQIAYFLDFVVLVGALYLFKNDDIKSSLGDMYEVSLLEKLHLAGKADDDKNLGNVQICVDKESKRPIVVPLKDRYLHMLVLGPTGCGKTSQIILPMINQDMQNLDCGITVIEPKIDLAEKVYAMAKHYGRKVLYFNPILPSCPYFNPLFGREEDVIENMATTFKMLNADSPQFFLDMNETLIRNSLKVLKRLYGDNATLIELARIVHNSGGVGRKIVQQFSRISSPNDSIAKENADIASWFQNDYFAEKSKTYEHCSGLRSQVAKITSNKFLRKVLNPPNGQNDLNFDKHLAEGGVIAIATAQGALRDLGRFLGYFIILQFQSAVFKRPGTENTRRAHFLYIDEFQEYSNPGFSGMLTQGRSYRVASHLATQNRALMAMGAGKDGKNFVELVSTNARNVILFPGGNAIDAKYYSDQFGEVMVKKTQKGISRSKFNPLMGIQKMNYPNESIRESEELEARFTHSDLIYRKFGEITYCIIRDNSVQTPGIGLVNWIPSDFNKKLDTMIEDLQQTVFSREDIIEGEFTPVAVTEDDVPAAAKAVAIEDPLGMPKKELPKPPRSGAKPIVVPRVITDPKSIEDLPDDDDIEVPGMPSTNVQKHEKAVASNSGFQFGNEDELL